MPIWFQTISLPSSEQLNDANSNTNSETIETEISIYIRNSVSDNTWSTESNDDDSVVTEYQCVEIGIY